ncbi:hypothetical protein CL655_04030 [bacterium]|nr:hypothetical protein [bacterium]
MLECQKKKLSVERKKCAYIFITTPTLLSGKKSAKFPALFSRGSGAQRLLEKLPSTNGHAKDEEIGATEFAARNPCWVRAEWRLV